MKKFKVIEESRFLNKQNLKQIVGGKNALEIQILQYANPEHN